MNNNSSRKLNFQWAQNIAEAQDMMSKHWKHGNGHNPLLEYQLNSVTLGTEQGKEGRFHLIFSFELPNYGIIISNRKMKMKMAIREIVSLAAE